MDKLKKGEHEKAMEKAKEMLDRGCGMGEIVDITHLSEENVMKAKRKREDQSWNLYYDIAQNNIH